MALQADQQFLIFLVRDCRLLNHIMSLENNCGELSSCREGMDLEVYCLLKWKFGLRQSYFIYFDPISPETWSHYKFHTAVEEFCELEVWLSHISVF